METLKSISENQIEKLKSYNRCDLANNQTLDFITSQKRKVWAVWDAIQYRSTLQFEDNVELEKYYLNLCTRVELGELSEDYQIEGCLNILKLKYLRYLEYSNKSN
jgi:hypothetical protein